jgi:hypothetical protein
MLRNLLVICCFICCVISVSGQALLKGRVYENKTRITLDGVWVENLTTKQGVTTDADGKFKLKARIDDILVFKKFSYISDTVLVTDLHEMEVFMVPQVILLNNVDVYTAEAPHMNTYYDPQFHGQTMVYQRDADLNYKGGMIFRLWYWKKDTKKREQREQLIKEQKMQTEIARIFKPKVIGKYVPLKNDELNDFISLYTPAPNIYFGKDFNLAGYLNNCYKAYLQLPSEKRHPDKLSP